MKFTNHMDSVELSRIRAISEKVKFLENQGKDIIHLQIGEPDFTTPINIIDAAKAALDRGETHYTPNRGILELRNAISKKLSAENGIIADPDTEIIVTSGCEEGLFIAITGLLDPDDEIIIIEPAFVTYEQIARIARARVIPVHAKEENGWLPDIRSIENAISVNTKMILINSPCNPTGAVYPKTLLEDIAALAIKHNIFVVSDEVYEKLVYEDAEHFSIGSIDGMQERTITINGFSKAYAMTGWRLGYLHADKALIIPMLKVHQYAVASCSSIAQFAAIEALENGEDSVKAMLNEYDIRRKFLINAFKEIPGVSCTEPMGGLYVYPNISKTKMTDIEFADKLLEEAGVATVPGWSFDSFSNNNIRICFATSLDSLKESIRRMKTMLVE